MGFIEKFEQELRLHRDSWAHVSEGVDPEELRKHIEAHVAEAKQHNDKIGDVEMRDLANRVAEHTEGEIRHLYTEDPTNSRPMYRFAPDSTARDRSETMAWLAGKLGAPTP